MKKYLHCKYTYDTTQNASYKNKHPSIKTKNPLHSRSFAFNREPHDKFRIKCIILMQIYNHHPQKSKPQK